MFIWKKLTIRINALYQKIINNKDEIENDFLIFLFEEFYDSNFKFWEWIGEPDTTCIIEEKIPKVVNIETIYRAIDQDKEFAVLSGMEIFGRYLPMIDVQKIIDSIIPFILEINNFDDDFMYSFEFNSMELGHDLLLAAVCQFNEDGKLFVRDNRG